MKKPRKELLLARVLRKVVVDIQTGCWLWQGALDSGGYGLQSVDNRNRKAHRVSWELHRDPIPDGACCLHKCDVPRCVNPDHLFLGSKADNNADMAAKGRHGALRGEGHYRAKLTKDAVLMIRCSPLSKRKLAKLYGVSTTAIYFARTYKSWRHVT